MTENAKINLKGTKIAFCDKKDCKFFTKVDFFLHMGIASWHTTANATHCLFCKHYIASDLYTPKIGGVDGD